MKSLIYWIKWFIYKSPPEIFWTVIGVGLIAGIVLLQFR